MFMVNKVLLCQCHCVPILVALERRAFEVEFVRVRQHSPSGAALRPDLDTGYCALQCVSSCFSSSLAQARRQPWFLGKQGDFSRGVARLFKL